MHSDGARAVTNIVKYLRRRLTARVYPTANHLFEPATTVSPMEYPTLQEAFATGLLDDIGGSIGTHTP